MVLNSLQIDPNKTWKGIWRWYSEEILHCTSMDIMKNGMSLEEITQLARCNGLNTMSFRPQVGNKDYGPYYQIRLTSTILDHLHSEPLLTTDSCCNKENASSAKR